MSVEVLERSAVEVRDELRMPPATMQPGAAMGVKMLRDVFAQGPVGSLVVPSGPPEISRTDGLRFLREAGVIG